MGKDYWDIIQKVNREAKPREYIYYATPSLKKQIEDAIAKFYPEIKNKMEIQQATVNVEFLCQFTTFEQWVAKASSWLTGFPKGSLLCLDINGNMLFIGKDFQVAKSKKLFPVRCYRMVRTSEPESIK